MVVVVCHVLVGLVSTDSFDEAYTIVFKAVVVVVGGSFDGLVVVVYVVAVGIVVRIVVVLGIDAGGIVAIVVAGAGVVGIECCPGR